MNTGDVDAFEANRSRMFGIAYRMLGEAAEAEDVVQDAYLRWQRSTGVDEPAAWLTKVVTNLCLTRLTSARARREVYVGPWLPEPVVVDDLLGPLQTVEQRESLEFGMLLLLERLTPAERAVFVLREAFAHSHREIGAILELDEANVRQLYRRARQHIGERRHRFSVDPDEAKVVATRLLEVLGRGDVVGLGQLLAEDVVVAADGGGKVSAARWPIEGKDKVVRYLAGLVNGPRMADISLAMVDVNGMPALLALRAGTVFAVIALEAVDGRLVAIRSVVNPDKLAFFVAQLARRGDVPYVD